jgi:hypothetical protein
MDMIPQPALRDRRILIVESEPPLLRELMRVLDNEDDEAVYVSGARTAVPTDASAIVRALKVLLSERH